MECCHRQRKMYGVELGIIIIATFAQALAAPKFLWGLGLEEIILYLRSSHQSALEDTTSSFDSCHDACQKAGDRAWRIIIGFGAVPAVFAMYWRLTIPETPRYTFDVAHDIEKAHADIKAYMNNEAEGVVDPILQEKTKLRQGRNLRAPKASWRDAFDYFSQWKNFKVFGLGLNNSIILNAIGYSHGDTIYQTLINNALGSLILVCAGAIPGYWLTVFTIDTIGRKPIQIIGFAILTILFCIIGFAYKSLSSGALLALYILAQLFFNFGPNTTTFIIPGECFPTRYRSTGHGLSAAMGKIGAVIAQVIAQPLMSKGAPPHCRGTECQPWLNHLMQIFAFFMFCGTLVSFLLPETKGRTLEELAGEGEEDEGPKPSWRSRIRIFGGGKPAGFETMKSPNLLPRSPGLRGKQMRVGIMGSPELLPKAGMKGKKRKGNSFESVNEGYTGSVSSAGRTVREEEEFRSGGVLPGWSAGWGVQGDGRGGNGNGRVESIMLNDVGRLLK
ncbi:putative Inorganic phosphate transporter PHO84 [Glarea lozoyensis 74030]|uniref:Putative Inorganic phosphate transporter PHO84 n=1 Tax=Glarea lozoyensis (strain ATCC 74030 / MF5533) TaxID=1104152 RepID=H0EYC8_GLAL7|nr:putative Inorganic phosphate transporter PHO84 [Glarea lozoyensis 74030]